MPTAIGSEIVCRAVGLVLDGVLDDETDLTITEVGFAAGFGSTRQFNRVCRSVFRHTPQELRTKRRRSDRHVADGGLTLRLAMHGRLDWPAMIDALDLAAVPGVEAVTGERYVRTIAVNGDPGVLELSRGDDDQPLLRLHLPYWRKLVHVVQRARRIMNLDQELTEPRACLGEDPIIGPLVRARPDVRPPGTWDGFEVGVQALLDRDAADPTRALLSRVVRRYGAPVAGLTELGLTHTFPTPEVLAEADLGWLDLPQNVLGKRSARLGDCCD